MSLAEAVEAGDVLRVRESLGTGESANDPASDGRTVLTWAVEFGNVPVIRALLEGGGDATAKDRRGENALERAVAAKRRNVVDLLAEVHAVYKGPRVRGVECDAFAALGQGEIGVEIDPHSAWSRHHTWCDLPSH